MTRSLTQEVAQNEYLARSLGYYLRREPYGKLVEDYVETLAKEHGVSKARVRSVRAAYVSKHPLDWQRKEKVKAKETRKHKKRPPHPTRKVARGE